MTGARLPCRRCPDLSRITTTWQLLAQFPKLYLVYGQGAWWAGPSLLSFCLRCRKES